MQRHLIRWQFASCAPSRKIFSSRAIAAALVLCACTPIVQAQSKKLGTYKGVIQVSESLDTPNYRFSYRATALPRYGQGQFAGDQSRRKRYLR